MKHSILGKITPEHFLKEFWQKKPLLIRQAIPDFKNPISADELAGLALEDDVESRIIIEHGSVPWELQQGPFTVETFSELPDSHWTLLVQAVDHWVPEIHSLLTHFHFLPRWRMDDIMISYATDGGNVGAHYDQYDVFLLQAEGKRRWQIGPVYDESSPTLPDTPLHILSEFEVQQDYVLEPGDMLYLPPGVGHHGIAEGECMTLSIGFRAPGHRDILMQFTDFIADKLPESLRYSDPDQTLPDNPAEIDDATLDRLETILRHYTEDRNLLGQWFGEMMTQPKYDQAIHNQTLHIQSSENEFTDWFTLTDTLEESTLSVSGDARFAYRKDPDGMHLFANGQHFDASSNEAKMLVSQLCLSDSLSYEQWSSLKDKASKALIIALFNLGVLVTE